MTVESARRSNSSGRLGNGGKLDRLRLQTQVASEQFYTDGDPPRSYDANRRSPMNGSNDVVNSNIRRFQNLLETSVDDTERQTLERLLTEEKARAALQASEPPKA
jgi:hypothetical protein